MLNSGWLDSEPGIDGTLKGFAFTREMATRYADRTAMAKTSEEIRAIQVIFSHSSTASICDVSRNVPDDVLRRLTKNGGVVMVSFVPEFTSKAFADWYDEGGVFATGVLEKDGGDRAKARAAMDAWEKEHVQPKVSMSEVADHIEHVRDIAGVDHVGLAAILTASISP